MLRQQTKSKCYITVNQCRNYNTQASNSLSFLYILNEHPKVLTYFLNIATLSQPFLGNIWETVLLSFLLKLTCPLQEERIKNHCASHIERATVWARYSTKRYEKNYSMQQALVGDAVKCTQGRQRKIQISSNIFQVFLTDRKILRSLEIGLDIRAWAIPVPSECMHRDTSYQY